jgi:phospholipid/cholesterol/gamma-HCH transport system permease protein
MNALLDSFVKRKVLAVQEFTHLLVSSLRHIYSPPRYVVDTLVQMDNIGFGSLPIVLLTGFFTGGVLALQTYRTLSTFGETGLLGQVVAISVVRELGPVLTALMVTGRNSSGIASEIGSMLVSEQIDAMRALGTDPLRKLVTPRLFASFVTLPLLTILSDFCGMLGGYLVSSYTVHLSSAEYWTSAYNALTFQDCFQGLLRGGDRAGRLLFRVTHNWRHRGGGPFDNAGRGRGLRVDPHPGFLHHQIPHRNWIFLIPRRYNHRAH